MPNPPNKCRNPEHRFSEANGRCLTCKAANQARYRGKNPEVVRVRQRDYMRRKRIGYLPPLNRQIAAALRSWK